MQASPSYGLAVTVLACLIVFILTWMLTSLAVFMAGRVVVGSRATFTKSLALIFLGGLLIAGFQLLAPMFLNPIFSWLLAFLLWIGLIKTFFGTGWLGGFAIAILASIMLMVLVFLAAVAFALVGLAVPFLPKTPIQPYMPVV
ncbi:MAG: hypothetical protein ACXQTV_04860 [Candidatus Hecatellaceae archaeon]